MDFPVLSGHRQGILDFSNPVVPSDSDPGNQSPDRPGHYIIDFSNPAAVPSINDLIRQTPPDQPPTSGGSNSSLSPNLPEELDYYDACLGYIKDMLMEEEDLDGYSAALLQDQRALEATEKSFYEALGQDYHPAFSTQNPPLDWPSTTDHLLPSSTNPFDSSSSYGPNLNDSNYCNHRRSELGFFPLEGVDDFGTSNSLDLRRHSHLYSLPDGFFRPTINSAPNPLSAPDPPYTQSRLVQAAARESNNTGMNQTEGTRRIHLRDESSCEEIRRSNKQLASYSEEHFEIEKFDDVLLLSKEDNGANLVSNHGSLGSRSDDKLSANGNMRRSKSTRKKREKKRSNQRGDEVDLRTLLTLCAQSVANCDLNTATEQLKQIRENSSPYGSSIQRVAHYFADALQARIASSGGEHGFTDVIHVEVPTFAALKAFECYVTATPISHMIFFMANRMIVKMTEKATRVHVIDFGIYHGYQWPSLIQQLSDRPMGPPRLKITGIDYPEHGFRPSQKVEATGRRLNDYCKRFKVPFEYHAIAKKWEDIKREDINLEEGELVVVNCIFRAAILLDETVEVNCPRDAFLRLIRSLKPDLFVHATVNGTFNAPFFITRFREALFYFTSTFDMFDATMNHESYERTLIEQTLHGEQIMNVVAREGAERVWRPETYKQWQVRTLRAGFRQLVLDQELVKRAKAIVETKYHKDFVVDVDGNWLLHGWKGRILFAICFWLSA